jgi:MFS family permease
MRAKQWTEIALLYIIGVTGAIGLGLMPPLAVDLRATLHGSTRAIGLVIGAVYIPFFAAGAFVGRAVNRLGPRVLLLGGAALMAIGGLSDLRAEGLVWWVGNILLMGLGLITVVVTAQTTLAAALSGKTQASILAIWATKPYVGGVCGLLLAAALAGTPHWRWAFAIQGLAVLGVTVLAALPKRLSSVAEDERGGQSGPLALLRERKALRLCVGYALVTLTSAGSAAIWPLYLSRLHGVSIILISKLMALTQPSAVAGPVVVGVLCARAVSPAKIAILLTTVAALSTAVLYTPGADLRVVTVAMALWGFAVGAVMAFSFALLPTLLTHRSGLGTWTGMIYQLSSICAAFGAPVFFAIAPLRDAHFYFVVVIAAAWLALAVTAPIWRLDGGAWIENPARASRIG